jgi:hypothetical protein
MICAPVRVRPGRPDIAAPDLPANVGWIGDPPVSMTKLTATGPALVHFFDFAQLNSVRALPYTVEWQRRYGERGLSVIGVQAPRFPFGANPEAVAAGLRRLGVSHPVAIDADREIWFDYGCSGWPSLFLWGRGGVLRWYHFGEGDYAATEEAIQEELRAGDALQDLPALLDPLRPSDAPGATVMPPTPEQFPAGEGTPLTLRQGDEGLQYDYAAGGAYATVEGEGKLRLTLDGGAGEELGIEGAGLYELAVHPRHESHGLEIEAGGGELRIWSLSFAPGVP